MLSQINISKDEALKELEKLKTKVIGKSTLKVAKHIIWDSISTFIYNNWSHFSLIGIAIPTHLNQEIQNWDNQ
jgi:hypothetical protein